MANLPKKFIISVFLCFCMLYIFFIHKESSYNFHDSSKEFLVDPEKYTPDKNIDVSSNSAAHQQMNVLSTDNIKYPVQTYTIGKENDKMSPIHYNMTKTAVILNCEGRSGSTWLSSLFWKNSHVFYVYEPLYPNDKNNRAMKFLDKSKEECQVLQLADTYKCKLDFDKKETMFPMVLGRYPTYQPELKHCHDTNSCPESLTSFCNSRTHVVQKVIRFYNISNYVSLQDKIGNIPLKIIHLVRDPRPHIISREKLFNWMYDEDGIPYKHLSADDQSQQRRKLCMRELANMKIGDSGIFDSSSYIRVSHEEMSLEPITWAKKLYDFVGLEFTEETKNYIEEITHGNTLVHNGKDPDGRFAGFSVYRDTMEILNKWKKASPKHLHDIELECKELLDYLGYVNIYDDNLNIVNEDPWPNLS